MDASSRLQRITAIPAAMLGVVLVSGFAAPPSPTMTAPPNSTPAVLESTTPGSTLAPFATLTVEAWRNAGGVRDGGWQVALLDFGAEFDLARFGGPAASGVMVQFQWMRNVDDGSFAEHTGAFNSVSGLMANDRFRVFNLHYRQSWQDGAFRVKFGQLALDDDFMGSESAGVFLNSAFGAMPSQVATSLCAECHHASAFPLYATAAPGFWCQWEPSESWTWQSAVYHGAPGVDAADNHGFAWWHVRHPGMLLVTELARTGSLGGHKATFRAGATYHTGEFDDFSAEPGATVSGLASFYCASDVVLIAPPGGKPRLAAFARVGASPQSDRSVVSAYVDGGLVWSAPFARRQRDAVGLALSCTRFSADFRRHAAPDEPAAVEGTVELTYRAVVTDAFTVQADVQWLFEPARNAAGDRRTATVLGLRAKCVF